MIVKNIIIILFFLIVNNVNAQSDFRPGFIINNSGDTIYGKIDYRGDLFLSNRCKFKGADNILHNYSPTDIKAYRFIEGKYYVSREVENKKVFLEYLINGEVNIYYLRDKSGDHYYIDKKDEPLTEIPYEEGIKSVDGKDVFYQSKKHVGILNYYMQDAPGFQSEIQSINELDHQNLIKLAEDYHNEVCKDEECIIYDKRLPFVKVSIEAYYGQTWFNDKYEINNSLKTPEIGSFIYFWMPRANEKFYFKTGLQLCQADYNGDKSAYLIFPTQIQYQYPHFKIQPKLFCGLNGYFIHKNISHWTIAIGGGLDYKFSNRISLTSNYTAEFLPVTLKIMEGLIPPSSEYAAFFSNSIYLGLKIDI